MNNMEQKVSLYQDNNEKTAKYKKVKDADGNETILECVLFFRRGVCEDEFDYLYFLKKTNTWIFRSIFHCYDNNYEIQEEEAKLLVIRYGNEEIFSRFWPIEEAKLVVEKKKAEEAKRKECEETKGVDEVVVF